MFSPFLFVFFVSHFFILFQNIDIHIHGICEYVLKEIYIFIGMYFGVEWWNLHALRDAGLRIWTCGSKNRRKKKVRQKNAPAGNTRAWKNEHANLASRQSLLKIKKSPWWKLRRIKNFFGQRYMVDLQISINDPLKGICYSKSSMLWGDDKYLRILLAVYSGI